MLAAAFEGAGAVVERLDAVADDAEAHREALERGLARTCSSAPEESRSARTTSSGGCWRELGVEEDFWGVAVQPGKPLAFGVRGRDARLRAPGNPVSSLVAVELFVRPALLALQGGPSQARAMARGSRLRCVGTPRATSSFVREPRRTAGEDGARAPLRPGVAHDRPCGGGRRARTRARG